MTKAIDMNTNNSAERAAFVALQAQKKDIRNRWLLSLPALSIIFFAAAGPLIIVVLYSFLVPGDYTGVKWIFTDIKYCSSYYILKCWSNMGGLI